MDLQAELQNLMGQIKSSGGEEKTSRPRVTFEWHPVQDSAYYEETGIVRFTDEVYIRASKPGSKSETHRKITEQDKRNNPREWAIFLAEQGHEQQDGFPIMEWYAATKGQATTLFRNGIKTVETLAGTDEKEIKKFGQPYIGLRDAAIAHIEQAEGVSSSNKLRAEIEKKTERIKTLVGKVKALEKEIGDLKNANTS